MKYLLLICLVLAIAGCKKSDSENINFSYTSINVDGISKSDLAFTNVAINPTIRIAFTDAPEPGSAAANIRFNGGADSAAIEVNVTFEDDGKTMLIRPAVILESFSNYKVVVSSGLLSKEAKTLQQDITITLLTGIDLIQVFRTIPDEELLNLVQKQTFRYFWDFAHPISGMARERNTSGDVVTTGGSGFGIMAILVAVHRNFISRADALSRMSRIVDFLKNKASRYHGAFPHWLNGATGAIVPFSAKDDGADLVETSYLVQGLLTARQFFSNAEASETALRNNINSICNGIEWSWFRKNNENVLYWHWSPYNNWDMNLPIRGWNEALITYVLAASSPSYFIPKTVYDNGWARNGGIKNGNTYFDIQLPLGPANGGPLFFAHYSFFGINPMGLSDAYANYEAQNKAHTLINYNYCVANPKKYTGYGDECWGLTASDDINGYKVHDPTNDNGVISPTAALSSFPYTPEQSMKALKFFYYKLGDKVWGEYGFYDAFSLHNNWFADSYLAIDQGPIIIMIENYRSALLWDLFIELPRNKEWLKKSGLSKSQNLKAGAINFHQSQICLALFLN